MNRIWIEPDHPAVGNGGTSDPDEINRIGRERAALVSNMIEKLGGSKDVCFWSERASRYCYGPYKGQMGFVEAGDHGHWFNLDFLGADHTGGQ